MILKFLPTLKVSVTTREEESEEADFLVNLGLAVLLLKLCFQKTWKRTSVKGRGRGGEGKGGEWGKEKLHHVLVQMLCDEHDHVAIKSYIYKKVPFDLYFLL